MNRKKIEITLSYKKIKIKKFLFLDNEKRDLDLVNTHYEFHSSLRIDQENELISIPLIVEIFNNEQKDIKYLELETSHEFHVFNLKKISTTQKSVSLPNEFLKFLYDTCYSTTRGIIYEKCAGTYLKAIVLPLLDTTPLIPKPQKINNAKRPNPKK